MIIKSINISAFGKHKNLELDFSEGLNIIYGSNEIGKSTLQAFIKAMFYGFNSRNRSIADNPRKKYTPWDSGSMGGEIIFCHNGLEYSLIREFGDMKSRDKVKLNYTSSGEPVGLGPGREPGEFLFDITQATFESTLFVGQLDSKIDPATAKDSEILTKLSNLAGTGDENTDINFIENNLEKAMRKLHAAKGQGGTIDKLKLRLLELKEELNAYNNAKNTSLKIIDDMNVYWARKDSILDEINRFQNQLKAATSQKSISEFETIKSMKERRLRQEALLEEVRGLLTINGVNIDRKFYEECHADFKQMELASDALAGPSQILSNAKETLFNLDKHLTNLEYLNHFNIETFEDINTLKNEFSRSIERKNSLDIKITDAMIALEEKQNSSKNSSKFIRIIISLLILMVSSSVAGAALINVNKIISFILIGLSGVSFVSSLIYYIINSKKSKKERLDLIYAESEVKNLNDLLNTIQSDIMNFISSRTEGSQRKINEILKSETITADNFEEKYILISNYINNTLLAINCNSIEEIRERLALYNSYKVQRNETMKTVSSLSETYTKKERISCDVTSAFYNKYSKIFSLSSIEDIKENLKNIFHNLNEYDRLLIDLKYASDYLKNALAGRVYEDIENNALSASDNGTLIDINLPMDTNIINAKLEELNKELNNIKDAISDTNVRIASNFKASREESEILADINEITDFINEYENQYECMKIARSVIKDSFNEIQQSFGPKLNERATGILNSIKPDNPVTIKVNRDFNITLSPKNSLLPYEIDYFSYGAQDQAYFALRMAISDILSADFEGFPLLLDDPFVQYDENRMCKSLDFLSDAAKSRQVFIFTCHKNVADYSSLLGGICFELNNIIG